MLATEILTALQEVGVTVRVNGDKLLVEPRSHVPEDLVQEIRANKTAIMATISSPVRVCQCSLPMPLADISSKPCQECRQTCWCTVCGGGRWCSFEEKWADYLVVNRSDREDLVRAIIFQMPISSS